MRPRRTVEKWNNLRIGPGEARDLALKVGESYSGRTIQIPLHVRRGQQEGPVVFVSAALHGDEINGTGAVRRLIRDETLRLDRGALILIPVLNPLGFEQHTRYLPDRRDLNRCFPGSRNGSLASRLARIIFDELVSRSDYGIDLHTAAVRRTNFPNVRADLDRPEVGMLAAAFGCEFIVDEKGPHGALRREACAAGCPTMILEAGEVSKVEPAIVETTVRGVRNVLAHLNMIPDPVQRPPFQIVIETTKWVRARRGGFLQFHVSPGEIVDRGKPLATHTSLLGRELDVLKAPFHGVVLGMTTLPAISPGEPVCCLGRLVNGTPDILQIRRSLGSQYLHERVIEDLATRFVIVNRERPERHRASGES